MELEVGQRCEISGKRRGEIAYIGYVEGIPAGEWVGVRLDLPFGKNDGSQGSKKYFECEPLHGVFVKPEVVNVSGSFPPFLVVQDDLSLEEKVKLVEDARAAQRETNTQRQKNQEIDGHFSRAQAIDSFWQQFSEKEVFIRQDLESIEPTSGEVSRKLDQLCLIVQEMRELAGKATLFLPPYDIRATQALADRLTQAIDAKRTALAPRKKFSFKARAKLQKDPSTLSQAVQLPTESIVASMTSHENEQVFADRSDELIRIDATDAPDLSLARLTNCTIVIPILTSAVRGHKLTNCKIYTGPIQGSLWLEHCENCIFVVACRQLRVHHTTNSNFFLRIKSHPIIEDCSSLGFSSYGLDYDGLEAQLQIANMATETQLFTQVHDFKWLRQQQSPHWRILNEHERRCLASVPSCIASWVTFPEG